MEGFDCNYTKYTDYTGISSDALLPWLTPSVLGVFPIFLMLGQQMVTSDEASEELWALADILYHICAFFDPQEGPPQPFRDPFEPRFDLFGPIKPMIAGLTGHVMPARSARPPVWRPRALLAAAVMRKVQRRATIWSFNLRTELVEEEERLRSEAPEAFEARK